MQTNKKFGFVLGVAAFIILLLVGDLDPTRPQVNTMAAIAVLMAILWITEALPLAATSLIPLIFFPITGILSTEEIASSYINSIIFLFLGGFLIAIAMEEWALHKRVALKIIKIFGGTSYVHNTWIYGVRCFFINVDIEYGNNINASSDWNGCNSKT